ncbi:13494_t:CDS:2 [Rhizophagus irregularis]|nr:13494_t:CDS:2 [Rhizophagus irregularis]
MSKLEGNNLRYQLNNAIDNVITERRIINKLHNKRHRYPKIPEFVKLIILPTDLFDPFNKKQTDIRGTSVIRKLYKSFDVACIPITIPTEKDSPKANSIKQQIEIMIKLNSSRNFLKYYGISNTIDTLIMIKEWAELGNLKEVHDNYNISWNVKIQIALDICRGICFMHENKILHHNLQCANIMMSGYCEPRITNFEYSYYMGDKTLIIPIIDNVINWAAPEQIENLVSYKYDTKCEVFSFGMLLWELAFERIPYQGWDAQKIKDHVLKNNRENIDSIKNEKVYEDYFEIVKNAWNQNPKDRDQFTTVFNKLEQLAFKARAKLWIEDMIEKKVIKSINWSEFKSDSVKAIGKGNFGSIIKTYWTNGHNYVVCKKLINSSDIQYKEWEAFKHELHMQSRAHSCENIIRILGISKSDKDKYHIHVMERNRSNWDETLASGSTFSEENNKNHKNKNEEKIKQIRIQELGQEVTKTQISIDIF